MSANQAAHSTASQATLSTGGYDCQWVEEPPSELVCQICLSVARDPHQHPGDTENECGKIFCRSCITRVLDSRSPCPNCLRSLVIFRDSKSE